MADTNETKSFMAKLNAMKGFILTVAALMTAVGSWFKPQDLKVTKSSYETLAHSMEEMGKEIDQNHDDIVAIRGYLEGLVKNGHAPIPVSISSVSPSLSTSTNPTYLIKPKEMVFASAMPSMHPKTPPTWKPVPFDQIKAKAKAE